MASLSHQWLLLWAFAIIFQLARAQNQSLAPNPSDGGGPQNFWAFHVLNWAYTGPANKDLGNEQCVVGFVAYFGFGMDTTYSDFNSEEHVDDTVLEYIAVQVNDWDRYLSCCPPYSKTNPAEYYRCNDWTGEANDNCHTPDLPFNQGKEMGVGAQKPYGTKWNRKVQWMYSFPSEGEGSRWGQGPARRLQMSQLADYWIAQAGGCPNCQGQDLEDGCFGQCIKDNLKTDDLIQLTNDALGDLDNFPNFGIIGDDVQGIQFWGSSSCLELSGGNSVRGTAIDLWGCNGLVNQAWSWGDDLQIKLAGHNEPGMCIDLPGGQVYNGNPLWLWACNGTPEQQWEWDGDTNSIRTKLNWNYCIDLPGGDTRNGNLLWLWECNEGSSQSWYLLKGNAAKGSSRVHTLASNRSRNATSKPKRGVSWMHNMNKHMQERLANGLDDADEEKFARMVPWYEKKEVKDWYAAQLPGPGLPRHMVPKGWKGYNTTKTLPPAVNVLV